jgi:hypothetical protein
MAEDRRMAAPPLLQAALMSLLAGALLLGRGAAGERIEPTEEFNFAWRTFRARLPSAVLDGLGIGLFMVVWCD